MPAAVSSISPLAARLPYFQRASSGASLGSDRPHWAQARVDIARSIMSFEGRGPKVHMPAPIDPKRNECFAVLVGYDSSQPEQAGTADDHVLRDGCTIASSEQVEI